MASKKICFLRALCFLVILSTFIGSTHSASCCLQYARRPMPCRRLLAYNIQTINASCDINAVIFHLPGRFVCANPLDTWTKRGIACVDERRRKEAEILNLGAAANTTAA